jgi:hypothetical protein
LTSQFNDKREMTMRTLLIAAAAALALASAGPSFAANDNQSRDMGGFHRGPMGQYFGGGRGAFAFVPGWCHMQRERIILDDGQVIFRRHRVCP